jgi:hypothetical protein
MWADISEYRIGDSGQVWSKIPILVDAFKKYPEAKWAWWLDVDAIIMDPNIDLASHLLSPTAMYSKLKKGEDFPLRGVWREEEGTLLTPPNPVPADINILITADPNGLNAGSIFFRRSQWTDMLLDFWIDPLYIENDFPAREQDTLIHIIRHHKIVSDHVGIVPQRLINAYMHGNDMSIWQTDDFVVHFAGCW